MMCRLARLPHVLGHAGSNVCHSQDIPPLLLPRKNLTWASTLIRHVPPTISHNFVHSIMFMAVRYGLRCRCYGNAAEEFLVSWFASSIYFRRYHGNSVKGFVTSRFA